MYENKTFIKLIREIENDENFNDLQRRMIRSVIRCTANFMFYDVAMKGNSIGKAVDEIEKMFPEEIE